MTVIEIYAALLCMFIC